MLLVRLARNTVDEFVTRGVKPPPPADAPDNLWKESGVFVTLNKISGSSVVLRGCIGRPYPTQPLIEAVIDSAVDSAAHDPRFPPVGKAELDSILVELSVLTPPEEIECSNPRDLLNTIEVGQDGLIASRGTWRGLLLPQVPVEWGWGVKEFVEHTCMKAGLPRDAWLDSETTFMVFQAEIFGEVIPRGKIIRNPLHQRS